MKTLRTIILITGILIAGLAINTTFAQSTVPTDKKAELFARKEEKLRKEKYKEHKAIARKNNREQKIALKEISKERKHTSRSRKTKAEKASKETRKEVAKLRKKRMKDEKKS